MFISISNFGGDLLRKNMVHQTLLPAAQVSALQEHDVLCA